VLQLGSPVIPGIQHREATSGFPYINVSEICILLGKHIIPFISLKQSTDSGKF
jgi:hypothetical protein